MNGFLVNSEWRLPQRFGSAAAWVTAFLVNRARSGLGFWAHPYQEPKGWIEIYDALGRLVQKRSLSGSAEEPFALRTEAGVYQVLVKVDGQAPRALRLVMLE